MLTHFSVRLPSTWTCHPLVSNDLVLSGSSSKKAFSTTKQKVLRIFFLVIKVNTSQIINFNHCGLRALLRNIQLLTSSSLSLLSFDFWFLRLFRDLELSHGGLLVHHRRPSDCAPERPTASRTGEPTHGTDSLNSRELVKLLMN